MTPGKFLRMVWPSKGFYCIAHPFKLPDGVTTYYHKVFPDIGKAVTHVHEMTHTTDVFFGVLSLREEKVWNPEKLNRKTGEKGAFEVRTQTNSLAAKCSFWDLDVGTEPEKYPTQRDALLALIEFLKQTQLPTPVLVSSGGGVHVYWPYTEDVSVEEWRTTAWNLRQLGEALGVKLDPTRTIDSASVLRVPDTLNWKKRDNPRPVKLLDPDTPPAITPFESFRQMVSDALVRAGVTATPAPQRHTSKVDDHGLGEQKFNDWGPPPTIDEVAEACGQVREMLRSYGDPAHPNYGSLDNAAWYRGMIGTIKHVEDGDNWCRKLTALHPRSVSDIEAKLMQSSRFPPATCAALQQFMPWKDAPCQKCKFLHDPSVPNPLAAARKTTVAAPPVVNLTPIGNGIASAIIPNPPAPYKRLKDGGVSLTRKDKDDNDQVVVIYEYDLYPIKRMVNDVASSEQHLWRVHLPRSGAKDFTLDADVLYDPRKFCAAISNNGIFPHKADVSALQDYMTAYVTQLQKEIDGEVQRDHLGWADDYKSFILPDKTLHADGSITVSALSKGAKVTSQYIHKQGDLATQVQLLHFYNDPGYIANQFAILNSLASILFYATGQHGIVVNMSGDAGASKSTTLYTGAGLFGDPALLPINGTARGATANARAQRVTVNANIPTFVDEITHIPQKEMTDLVMNITQPGHRLRLGTDGAERQVSSSYKSAIMLTTANSSLHSILSADNTAGTAGSMRVLEMRFLAQNIHSKPQADEFLRQIKLHFGHIGEIVASFVVRNRVAVEHRVQAVMREVDLAAGIAAAERFWSADIAAVIVTAEIAAALHLLPYSAEAIRTWAITRQIPYMRGTVKDEYRDPLAILTDYIAEKQGNILVVSHSTTIGNNTSGKPVASDTAYPVNHPHGALLGHYDQRAGVLYLLKSSFKEHCMRIGALAVRILDELNQSRAVTPTESRRIITNRNIRKTLGAGTDYAKGQTWCFAIDMTHPDISGAVPLSAVAGGTPISAPAGNLKAVP